MNFIEFPLTVLKAPRDGSKSVTYRDEIKDKGTGEVVTRELTVTGADKWGLPLAIDDDVLLALLKFTHKGGLNDPKVEVTRYQLCEFLHWATDGRAYARLEKCLDRLSGVRIKCDRAFWHPKNGWLTKNFGIIGDYQLPKRGGACKESFVRWDSGLFEAVLEGEWLKKLDFEFYMWLKQPLSKRMFRFLDKYLYRKERFERPLRWFALEKMGLSRKYRKPAKWKQVLAPAIEELEREGFIGRTKERFLGRGADCRIVFEAGRGSGNRHLTVVAPTELVVDEVEGPTPPVEIDADERTSSRVAENPPIGELSARVIAELGARGVGCGDALRWCADETDPERLAWYTIDEHDRRKENNEIKRSGSGLIRSIFERGKVPEDYKTPAEREAEALELKARERARVEAEKARAEAEKAEQAKSKARAAAQAAARSEAVYEHLAGLEEEARTALLREALGSHVGTKAEWSELMAEWQERPLARKVVVDYVERVLAERASAA